MQFSPSVYCSLQRSLWVWLLYYVDNWKQLTSWIFTFYLVFQLGLTLASHVKHKGRWFQGESGGGCQIIAFVANNGKLAPERRGEERILPAQLFQSLRKVLVSNFQIQKRREKILSEYVSCDARATILLSAYYRQCAEYFTRFFI